MSNEYDVASFELDYCQQDVTKITKAVKDKTSRLIIGMPGCGKSRLISFVFTRPDVLVKYGLSDNLKSVRVDGDIVATDQHSMYIELLSALGADISAFADDTALKNRLGVEVQRLETDVDLVVIFDNFNRPLQQALGEDFLKFLYGLRDKRPKLNISYIFMANLKIDLDGFYKVARLFDEGVDRSICWLSLLDRKDTFFSIERQWHRVGAIPSHLNKADQQRIKERIYELGGGHALLGRYLAHLMLNGTFSVENELEEMLKHRGIRSACEAIWNDLEQPYKNLLIDVANGLPAPAEGQAIQILRNYGVLKAQAFFSPIFQSFVKEQKKASEVVNAGCDEDEIRIIIQTVDDYQMAFTLKGLSPKGRVLLCYLLANQGETCTRDQLITIGWPSDDKTERAPYIQALSRQIDRIRTWLREQKQLSRYIAVENVWGVGYKIVIKG